MVNNKILRTSHYQSVSVKTKYPSSSVTLQTLFGLENEFTIAKMT
jgi:hypothetical protein